METKDIAEPSSELLLGTIKIAFLCLFVVFPCFSGNPFLVRHSCKAGTPSISCFGVFVSVEA